VDGAMRFGESDYGQMGVLSLSAIIQTIKTHRANQRRHVR